MQTPVTVVCGPDRDHSLRTARRILGTDPARVLVEHDLAQVTAGLVGRTEQWGDGRVEATVVELAHGCVSCTLREDVLPALIALARSGHASHIVLLLPDVVEPAGFVEAFHGSPVPDPAGGETTAATHCRISRIVAVVDAPCLVPIVAEGLTLAETGRAAADADDRTLGEVAIRQVETADVVVASDAGPTERALIELLNPGVRLVSETDAVTDVLPVDLFDLERALDRGDPSVVAAGPEVRRDADAWSVTWRARAPFHPGRLHDALTDLTDTVLRSRGTAWLAGHPGAMVGWDGVGPRVSLGVVGPWLVDAEPCAWDHAHPHHRLRAELDWDATFGDRYQELCLTGVGELPHRAVDALAAALLTEVELRATDDGRRAPVGEDPFADVFIQPDHDPTIGISQESA
ncbi:MAG: CobW family GTP-binding protein [Kineosporiaceae bacterium]